MVILKEDKLIISIHETSPSERRDWLVKAIAAAMRWKASANINGADTDDDNENQVVLAQLLEELIDIEKAIST